MSRTARILGTGQLLIAIFGLVGMVAAVAMGRSVEGSCFGLGCTGAIIAYSAAVLCGCLAVLAIPAWGWLRGKRWAKVVNVIALLPLLVVLGLLTAVIMDARYQPTVPTPAPLPETQPPEPVDHG